MMMMMMILLQHHQFLDPMKCFSFHLPLSGHPPLDFLLVQNWFYLLQLLFN